MALSSDLVEATERKAKPRAPRRGRGIARYGALLDATDGLLADLSPDDVGLYQIAEKAGVPPASVYHFFPTKEAAFLALTQRYLEGLRHLDEVSFDPAELRSWQDLMALDQRNARSYYNGNPAILKLLFSGYGGIATRRVDNEYTEQIAAAMYERYDAAFHMPFIRDPARVFRIYLAILDSVWALSFLKHGEITDDYYREGLAACEAYCRMYLPERVETRDVIRSLRGHAITMADILAPEGVGGPSPVTL